MSYIKYVKRTHDQIAEGFRRCARCDSVKSALFFSNTRHGYNDLCRRCVALTNQEEVMTGVMNLPKKEHHIAQEKAELAGETRYRGQDCIHHGSVWRSVAGGQCIDCLAAARLAAKNKPVLTHEQKLEKRRIQEAKNYELRTKGEKRVMVGSQRGSMWQAISNE